MKEGLLAVSSAPAGPLGAEAEEENYSTGDASLDNIRNQDNIGERELLAVSFGTSYNDSRRLTIGAIEEEMERAFPEFSVRRAFTSPTILRILKERDGLWIDSVEEALERAVQNGVEKLVIQPTHLMHGLEYQGLMRMIETYRPRIPEIVVGEPLFASMEDIWETLEAVLEDTKEYNIPDTAVCLMGHGTTDRANAVYEVCQRLLKENGYDRYFIGTVEADPTLDQVVQKVEKGNYRRVVLQPFMLVAGDHANQDMAGMGKNSWKSTFEAEGYEVVCRIRGLGELPGVRRIYVRHAKEAARAIL